MSNNNTTDSNQNNTSFLSKIRWGESYVSLLLGGLVVIVAAALGFFYVKAHQPKQELLPPATIAKNIKLTISPSLSPEAAMTPTVSLPTKSTQKNQKQQTYTVQKNDNLWSIAEKVYGSGYNWISIAQANNLANPGMIFSGDNLVIPSVTPILIQTKPQQILPTLTPTKKMTPTPSPKPTVTQTPTVAPKQTQRIVNAITGNTYTVKAGDSLWDIAIRAYGNGDRWVDIAKANNLTNPSVIHSGNVLTIPHKQTL